MRYETEELQKYKKGELINLIHEISNQYNHLQNEHERYKEKAVRQMQSNLEIIKNTRDAAYEDFLNGNKKHLERFMTEFIQKHLCVNLSNSACGGYYNEVLINGRHGQQSGIIYPEQPGEIRYV